MYHHKYTVVEDNGGGLHLFVTRNRQAIFSHSGYEYNPGQLTQDLAALEAGDDPATWENNDRFHMTEVFRPSDIHNWQIVATGSEVDKRKLYPARMGRAAQIEFNVSDEQVDAAQAAARLGSIRSQRKAAASAANGAKGGRPRQSQQ